MSADWFYLYNFFAQKLPELQNRLISLNSGEENAVKCVIEDFSINVPIDEESVLNK